MISTHRMSALYREPLSVLHLLPIFIQVDDNADVDADDRTDDSDRIIVTTIYIISCDH